MVQWIKCLYYKYEDLVWVFSIKVKVMVEFVIQSQIWEGEIQVEFLVSLVELVSCRLSKRFCD